MVTERAKLGQREVGMLSQLQWEQGLEGSSSGGACSEKATLMLAFSL